MVTKPTEQKVKREPEPMGLLLVRKEEAKTDHTENWGEDRASQKHRPIQKYLAEY